MGSPAEDEIVAPWETQCYTAITLLFQNRIGTPGAHFAVLEVRMLYWLWETEFPLRVQCALSISFPYIFLNSRR